MKKGFTLIELILVIAIIAIIGGIGFSSMKSDYANQDGSFLLLKIKEARYKAIGYVGNKNDSCLNLTKDAINNREKNNPKVSNPYEIRSNITITSPATFVGDELCFDSLGRAHEGSAYGGDEIILDNLLQENLNIRLANGNDSCLIRVHSLSGYAIITCN